MKILKRVLLLLLIFILLANTTAEASSKIKINKTKTIMYVGDSLTLKLSGVSTKQKDKIKWSTSNKKIATVSKKGKVRAKKKGKVVITATYKKKKYKCAITLKNKKKVANVVEVTSKDNMNSLINFINKNGFDAPKTGYKMIRWEDAYGDGKGEGIKILPNNMVEFVSMADEDDATAASNKGYYGSCYLTLDYNNIKTIDILFENVSKNNIPRITTSVEVNISELINKNNIKIVEDESINESLNTVLDIVLERLNTFMLEDTKFSLQDVGFENYK